MLTLLLGGARSGKSALALQLASAGAAATGAAAAGRAATVRSATGAAAAGRAASGTVSTAAVSTAAVPTGPGGATLIATAEALDPEMAARISAHRAERPSSWSTVEEPLDVGQALREVGDSATVVIDCLTLWVSNLLGAGYDDATIGRAAGAVAALAAGRSGTVIAVSNEVGSGIVPADPLSRRYRDLLGQVNVAFARHASKAFLVVAGRVLALLPAPGTEATAGL